MKPSGSVRNSTLISRQLVDVGQQPRLGAVGQVAVGQQDHRRHVLDRDPHRFEGAVEAIGRAWPPR